MTDVMPPSATVIADMQREIAALKATLAQRNSECGERIEQQAATIDVLKVMSASPDDAQPVMRLVVERARAFCEADGASLALLDGDMLHLQAYDGFFRPGYEAVFPRRVSGTTMFGRAVLACDVVQVADVSLDPDYYTQERSEHVQRAIIAVPLLRVGKPIGAIAIGRRRPGEYSAAEVELLKTFAEQAVIAISSAELYRGLHEALEQQTATAEVLRVINESPGNLEPVFDKLLEKARAVCGVDHAALELYDGEQFRAAAVHGASDKFAELLRQGYRAEESPAAQALVGGECFFEVLDATQVNLHTFKAASELDGVRTVLFVPLRRDDALVGMIASARREVRAFTEKEIALLQNFAAQAVLAIENARLLTEQREALEQQTATAEVLGVINSSPGNLRPVFDAILEKAHSLCGAIRGAFVVLDGEEFQVATARGLSERYVQILREAHRNRMPGDERSPREQLLSGASFVQHSGPVIFTGPVGRAGAELKNVYAVLFVPLRQDGRLLGYITAYREQRSLFSDKQIALLQNFAAQAVVAMENARLINETREALEQQTATSEVLGVINSSPGDLKPVFDAILEKAHSLCGADLGSLASYDGELFRRLATHGYPPEYQALVRAPNKPLPYAQRLLDGERFVHEADLAATALDEDDPFGRGAVEFAGTRTILLVPLRKDGRLLGYINAQRREVRPFSQKEIALLESFAAQAVIAMENARLLNEVRQRQEELRITFENMGDGVAMFDETQHLVAWNGKFQEILDLPDGLLDQHLTYEKYLRFLAARGDFGPGVETVEQIDELVATTGQPYGYERTRPDGRVIEILRNPVPDGGFVLIFSDITERKRNEEEIRAARDAAEAAYRDLKVAQASLIQAEKMASLGQLTAGIAHEIKNPLNFVNNFADLSVDLLNELHDALAADQRAEIDEVTAILKSNLAKIAEHGRRADSIVKNMLLHSRTGPSEHRLIDLNSAVEEALNLAYHGARAQMQGFNITMQKQLDPAAGIVEIFPQEFTRVLLNLISNGFYAVRQRAASADGTFEPTLLVTTRDCGDQVQIQVRDNGAGISEQAQTKIFEPFFTTKPAGEGTGLGLSLSYDIIVKQHGGQLTVESRPNAFTQFVITLPRKMATNQGART